jgi:hypothetical protein
MTCINCQQEVSGTYCPNCGQRSTVKRITFREGWNDFWSRVYGFDGMFPRTLRDLTIRPGVAARKFIDGNRIQYYGPVGYFFLMVTLFLIVASMLGIDIKEFYSASQSTLVPKPKPGSGQEEFNKMVMDFVADNTRILAFAMIPFNALASRYLLFRKSGMNYLEHMVMPFYLTGHIYWLNIASLILYKLTSSFFLHFATAPVSFFYFAYAYTTFIGYQAKWKSFIKGLLVYGIGMFFFIIAISIISISLVILLVYLNPEAFEMLRPSNNP